MITFERNKIYKAVCIKDLKTYYIEFTKGKVYNFYIEDINFKEDTIWVFENIKRKNIGRRFYSTAQDKFLDYFSIENQIRKQKLQKLQQKC